MNYTLNKRVAYLLQMIYNILQYLNIAEQIHAD